MRRDGDAKPKGHVAPFVAPLEMQVMKARLTDLSVARLKPPNTGRLEVWDLILPAFGLRLTAAGRRSWIVAVRKPGAKHPVRYRFGDLPKMKLGEARSKARDLLEDPAATVEEPDTKAEREAAEVREQEERLVRSVVGLVESSRCGGRASDRPGLRPEKGRAAGLVGLRNARCQSTALDSGGRNEGQAETGDSADHNGRSEEEGQEAGQESPRAATPHAKGIRKRTRKLLPAKLAEIEAKKAKGLPPFDRKQDPGAAETVVMLPATGMRIVLTTEQFVEMVERFEQHVDELRQAKASRPRSEAGPNHA